MVFCDRAPGMVVVSIDINRQDVELPRNRRLLQDRVETVTLIESNGFVQRDYPIVARIIVFQLVQSCRVALNEYDRKIFV